MENFYKELKRALGVGMNAKPQDKPQPESVRKKQFMSRLSAYKHVAAPSSQDSELKDLVAKLVMKKRGTQR